MNFLFGNIHLLPFGHIRKLILLDFRIKNPGKPMVYNLGAFADKCFSINIEKIFSFFFCKVWQKNSKKMFIYQCTDFLLLCRHFRVIRCLSCRNQCIMGFFCNLCIIHIPFVTPCLVDRCQRNSGSFCFQFRDCGNGL